MTLPGCEDPWEALWESPGRIQTVYWISAPVGFNKKSGVPMIEKEAILKRDQITWLILLQISIVAKDLWSIPFQHKASRVRNSPLMYKLTNVPNVVACHLWLGVAHYQRAQRGRLQYIVSLEIVDKPSANAVTGEEWPLMRRFCSFSNPIKATADACYHRNCQTESGTRCHQTGNLKSPRVNELLPGLRKCKGAQPKR